MALLVWGFVAGGGVGNVFTTSAELQQGQASFWAIFPSALAANVGDWVTLSLNIPDFTRYAKSQQSQVFGEAIWDPVQVVTRVAGDLPAALILAMIIIVIAQISTNMAANVVSPSFDFSNLAPKYVSFRTGGVITAILGVVSFPWVLFNNVGAYVFTWLVGYGSLLGAIGAVMIVDYWIVRRRQLNLAELYKSNGSYSYSNGWSWRAIVAVLVSVALVLPGFVKAATTAGLNGGPFPNPTFIESLYNYGLFLTFTVSALVYLGLSMIGGRAAEPVREPEAT